MDSAPLHEPRELPPIRSNRPFHVPPRPPPTLPHLFPFRFLSTRPSLSPRCPSLPHVPPPPVSPTPGERCRRLQVALGLFCHLNHHRILLCAKLGSGGVERVRARSKVNRDRPDSLSLLACLALWFEPFPFLRACVCAASALLVFRWPRGL